MVIRRDFPSTESVAYYNKCKCPKPRPQQITPLPCPKQIPPPPPLSQENWVLEYNKADKKWQWYAKKPPQRVRSFWCCASQPSRNYLPHEDEEDYYYCNSVPIQHDNKPPQTQSTHSLEYSTTSSSSDECCCCCQCKAVYCCDCTASARIKCTQTAGTTNAFMDKSTSFSKIEIERETQTDQKKAKKKKKSRKKMQKCRGCNKKIRKPCCACKTLSVVNKKSDYNNCGRRCCDCKTAKKEKGVFNDSFGGRNRDYLVNYAHILGQQPFLKSDKFNLNDDSKYKSLTTLQKSIDILLENNYSVLKMLTAKNTVGSTVSNQGTTETSKKFKFPDFLEIPAPQTYAPIVDQAKKDHSNFLSSVCDAIFSAKPAEIVAAASNTKKSKETEREKTEKISDDKLKTSDSLNAEENCDNYGRKLIESIIENLGINKKVE